MTPPRRRDVLVSAAAAAGLAGCAAPVVENAGHLPADGDHASERPAPPDQDAAADGGTGATYGGVAGGTYGGPDGFTL